jgi:hypothetical protein
MKIYVKFRTLINLIWAAPINGREAFTFVKGFPATFFLTERRAIVVGEFTEKMGWLQKKAYHRVCFEAGLHQIKEWKHVIDGVKQMFLGYITFHAHGDLGEGAMIQFVKLNPTIAHAIDKHLNSISIKNPVEDSGIILIDDQCPRPQDWLNKRYGKNALNPAVNVKDEDLTL